MSQSKCKRQDTAIYDTTNLRTFAYFAHEYASGISQSTGYGLTKPEISQGFLKIDLSIILQESILATIVRNPWTYSPFLDDKEAKEDDSALSAIYVSAYSLLRIFELLSAPPFLVKNTNTHTNAHTRT